MFQDIRMPRKSLREVLPGNGSEVTPRARKLREVMPNDSETDSVLPPPPRPRRAKRRGRLGPKLMWVMIILVVLVAATFFISKSLSVVSVEVVSKQFDIALNGAAFTVPYESVTIPTITEERTVSATLGTGTPKKAGGTIVVYNNYSSASQALIANTRFEAASGKIYRITKPITVPGTKVVGGKTVPGSIEVAVVADATGSSYNAPLTDFKIPGFKGDPKYDKFYAKSKTPMTGGSAGQEWLIGEAERTKTVAELKTALLQKAAEQIRFQIPENFVLYENNLVTTFKEEVTPVSTGSSGQATLTLSAETKAIIFDRDALSRALVGTALPEEDKDQPFTITNLDELGISLDQNSLKSGEDKVTITAEGTAKVKLAIDSAILRSKLIGVNAREAQDILAQFPTILTAKVSFRPPWIRQFPGTVERIKVVIP